MKLLRTVAAAALLLGASVQASGQEIKCDQTFMNPSEKQICASEDLMRQDQIMGEMYRRVEPHVDGIKKTQREFRRGLKSCKGDHECLLRSYDARIEELKADINSLPMASEEQIGSLAQAAEAAAEERNDQADERAEIASKMPVSQPVIAVEPPVLPPPVAEIVAAPVVAQVPSVPFVWPTWLIVLLVAAGLGVMWVIWELIKSLFRRCDRCHRWMATEVYDTDERSHMERKLKTVTDVHRNKNREVTSTTDRKMEVDVRVTNRTDHVQCKYCKAKWLEHSVSRS